MTAEIGQRLRFFWAPVPQKFGIESAHDICYAEFAFARTEDKAMLRSNLSAVRDLRGDGRATETAARLCRFSSPWKTKAI